MRFAILASLSILPLLAVAQDYPTSPEVRVYKCVDKGEYQYCVLVYSDGASVPESEIRSVSAAAKSGLQTEVSISLDDPISYQCGSSHGMSACCRIIGTDPTTGAVYIACGN